jgi:opacity protein-like surface antigen
MFHGLFARSAAGVLFFVALAWSEAGNAQNYDGNHQVRGGLFLEAGKVKGDATTAFGPDLTESYSFSSLGLGFSGGLEWIRGERFAWGVEIDGAALRGSDHAAGRRFGLNYLATARVRAGIFLRPHLLWYGTVGIAGLGMDVKDPVVGIKEASINRGLAAGTGLEFDYGGGIFFVEYLHTKFNDIDARVSGFDTTTDLSMNAIRVGLKFKLGHDYYHDDVARRIGK